MSQKRSSTKARTSRTAKGTARMAKVAALIRRPGTAGEQLAAEAALERLGGLVVRPTATGNYLTDAIVRQLPAPAKGNKITYDGGAPVGFGVRVTAAGSKSFILNYRVRDTGQERRVTIGEFGSWSTSAARAEAKKLRSKVDGGGDPRGEVEERREAPTMADLCDRFEKVFLPKKRAATQDAYSRLLRIHIRPHFGKFTRVADVRYSDVDRLHRNVTKTGSTYSANRCVAVCSKMFSLAIQLEWRTTNTNPAKGVERNPEIARERYLTGEELARLTTALAKHPDKQFTDIVRLLMLTGARSAEVFGMKWADLDLTKGVWTKLAVGTKQAKKHVVPLSEPVVTLLKIIERGKNEFVFPGNGDTGHIQSIKKSWASLCKAANISGLRVHDLRHNYASQVASSGLGSLPLIGALLGHSSPVTTARYSHLFDDPQRAATEKVGVIIGAAGKGGHHG
jgi:integrase